MLFIIANLVLHECTKHTKIDFHSIRDRNIEGKITTLHVSSHSPVTYVLMKPLSAKQHNYLIRKLWASAKPPLDLRVSNEVKQEWTEQQWSFPSIFYSSCFQINSYNTIWMLTPLSFSCKIVWFSGDWNLVPKVKH